MADNFKKDDDHLSDHWLSKWEQNSLDEWDSDSSLEERIQAERDRCNQKSWASFQASASSISQLYKDGCQSNCVSLWLPFQNSASAVTLMYKDNLDVMNRCFELGSQYATKRQTKEMLSWVKKRKRNVRREDLIGYICGKPPPPPRHGHNRSSGRIGLDRASPRLQSPRVDASSLSPDPADLQPFCDALALQGLDGAMSSFRLGAPGSPQTGNPEGSNNKDDIQYYNILNELSRRNEQARKRTSANEHALDSPTRKKNRLF